MDKIVTSEQQRLINELLSDPVHFVQDGGIQDLISVGIDYKHLRGMICRIYDINEDRLHEISNANKGTLGKLNRKSTKNRNKLYEKKIDKQELGKKYYRLYVEGDSWFQFPRFMKDIIDWLNDHDDFLIKSDAYGGDWITNIIYEGQYIEGLTTYPPDAFLISGGGNDLVGDHRLAVMVSKESRIKTKKYNSLGEINSPILNDKEKQMILDAQKHLNKEFYALLAVFELQYSLMFGQLYAEKSKFSEMITITQGYDYPVPSPKRRVSFRTPLQPLVNSVLDTGNWLYTPLKIKGIIDEYAQRSIMFAMIFEFNEMLSGFSKKYEKIFHVDSRGLTSGQKDWYDELHLKKSYYKRVAKAYEHIIRNYESIGDNRIVRSKDF